MLRYPHRLRVMTRQHALKHWILGIYDRTTDVVIMGLVMVMVLVLVFAFVDVLTSLAHLFPALRRAQVDEVTFREMVGNVLDVFIIVELFSTFTSYIRTHHVRISMLLDVTIVFALRELLVKLYAASFSTEKLIGLCVIVIILVVARSIANHFSPLNDRLVAADAGKAPERES